MMVGGTEKQRVGREVREKLLEKTLLMPPANSSCEQTELGAEHLSKQLMPGFRHQMKRIINIKQAINLNI